MIHTAEAGDLVEHLHPSHRRRWFRSPVARFRHGGVAATVGVLVADAADWGSRTPISPVIGRQSAPAPQPLHHLGDA